MKIIISEKQLNKLLNEDHSISSTVMEISQRIFSEIDADMTNKETYRSQYHTIKFKEGEINCDLSEINKKLGSVKIFYTIYFPKDELDIKILDESEQIDKNSSYDDETNELELVTWFYNNQFSFETESILYHELTHLFQYRMGLVKRKELYDAALDLHFNKEAFSIARMAGHAMYFTFPHEQDAYVHQYYSLLKKGYSNTPSNFIYYKKFQELYEILNQNRSNIFVVDAIKELKYTPNNYFRRLEFSLKRFKKKLTNAWLKHNNEINESKKSLSSIMESNLRRMSRICNYNYDPIEFNIKFKLERFYQNI